MVEALQTVGSAGGGAQLYVRASSVAALSVESSAKAESAATKPVDQIVTATGKVYRYNSFEFSYRQDFGKIVLLRQKPDTGEVVQQFPSEYYLKKYAASERAARNATQTGADPAASTDGARTSGALTASATVSAPAPAPAPAVSAAPTADSGAAGGSVDVTI